MLALTQKNSGLQIIKAYQPSSILRERRPISISLVWNFRSTRTEKILRVWKENSSPSQKNVYMASITHLSSSPGCQRAVDHQHQLSRPDCFYSRIWYQAKVYKCEDKDIFRCARFRKLFSTSPFLTSYKGVILEREGHGKL